MDDKFDEIIEDLGLEGGAPDSRESYSEGEDNATSQQHSLTNPKADSLQQLLAEFDQPSLTSLVAKLCRSCGWTTEIKTDESASVGDIQARRFLPHPESVRVFTHTASRVDGESLDEVLAEATEGTTTKQTVIVSEQPSNNALENIQQDTVELVNLEELAKDILNRGLTDQVIQHADEDEKITVEFEDFLESSDESMSHKATKKSTDGEQRGDSKGTSDSTQVSITGTGDFIDIEVVGFGNKFIEFEDRDQDLLEEREYTVICLHVKNKTSYEWSFRASRNLAVTSTDGFSYDNPQSNGWSSRTGQFTPWNNGKRHDIKPNSKIRAVVIYKTWFEPERLEYSADLLHVHGDESQSEGTERISIEIDDANREALSTLPESLPIDSVVLN